MNDIETTGPSESHLSRIPGPLSPQPSASVPPPGVDNSLSHQPPTAATPIGASRGSGSHPERMDALEPTGFQAINSHVLPPPSRTGALPLTIVHVPTLPREGPLEEPVPHPDSDHTDDIETAPRNINPTAPLHPPHGEFATSPTIHVATPSRHSPRK